jgi:hypothetical protein
MRTRLPFLSFLFLRNAKNIRGAPPPLLIPGFAATGPPLPQQMMPSSVFSEQARGGHQGMQLVHMQHQQMVGGCVASHSVPLVASPKVMTPSLVHVTILTPTEWWFFNPLVKTPVDKTRVAV